MTYDLIAIGGGPAGEKAAAAAAYFGKRVALIERAPEGPGGSTVHTGTLPSKTLRETALYLTGFRSRQLYSRVSFDFNTRDTSVADLMCRLPQVRDTQTEQIRQNLERHHIELISGTAVFEDPTHVRVGDRVLEASHFIIATGSGPRRPPGFDFSDPGVFDSDTLLRLEQMPKRLAVIGGGVIGSEYACVFAALGVQIEIIESQSRVLGFLDEEISDAIMASMRKTGIVLNLSDGVERLAREQGRLVLTLKSGARMEVDQVLVSAGRTGNTREMGLEAVGVKLDDRGLVIVDEDFRTNVPNIFAAGDVIGRPALASASKEQGRMAVAKMFGLEVPQRDWSTMASGIYTIPEACCCGPTEEELKRDGVPYVVGRAHMRHNARGQIIGDTDGFVKLIFHRQTKKLLATHLICERATELIHVGQAVMRLGGGIDYFVESVMTFPSLSVAYKYAAYDALGELSRGGDRPRPMG
ncbi:MAG: Si-specific NAD(P)(+) transhydrogenase [Deltaproteobacteria bacterium]|nr:Si-specific NAD(P)(+) transhydrogenase [Deltaproteobacteria bacterium]